MVIREITSSSVRAIGTASWLVMLVLAVLSGCDQRKDVEMKPQFMTCRVNGELWEARSFENALKVDSLRPGQTKVELRGRAANGSIVGLTLFSLEVGTYEFKYGEKQECIVNYTTQTQTTPNTDMPVEARVVITASDPNARRLSGTFELKTRTPQTVVSNTLTEGRFTDLSYQRK